MFKKAKSTGQRSFNAAWVHTVCGLICATAMVTLPQISEAQDLSGFYGGLSIGREIGKDAPNDAENAFGGFAGYNFDMGSAVVGGEFSYNAPHSSELEQPMHIKGRVGIPVVGGLLYGTAGLARAKVEEGGTAKGSVYGIGYDFAVSENFTVGAEYLRSQYRDVGSADDDIETNSVTLRAGFRF